MSQPQQKTHTLDAQSFGALHQTYHDRLLSSVTGMVRDRNKAEDITAKAFQIGWKKRDQFRGESSPYTWLHAIARSQVWQAYPRRESLPLDARADEIAAPGDLLENLERQDAIHRLRRALAQIPAVYRRVLVACFLNGESTRCVAEREGVPQGTVLSRVFTGKRLLRARLKTTP
jgi:RNA polymerase sigma-70 factor (ECF subfamily)